MRIAVVGGGAAGLAASYAAAVNGAEVLLFEKNEKLGKKLFISGKGRCNLTNDSDLDNHLKNIVRNPRFLYSAFHALSPSDLMALIECAGTPLKTERGGRVFPISDKSSDVISAWKKLLNEVGVTVKLNECVRSVKKTDDGFLIESDGGVFSFDKVIVATGGITYRATGSDGDGYRFAEKLGHTLTPLVPALVGIKANLPDGLAGLSLKNVELTAIRGKETLFRDFGEMLFTHTGISGPIVLTASSRINRLDLKEILLSVDLKPALDDETLDARLVREFGAQPNKAIRNVMPALLPKSLIDLVLERAEIKPHLPCNAITREERKRLVSVLKGLTVQPTAFEDFNGAIVTSGGVDVTEINAKDMQSKLLKGLYFAGEILDVDALTGGYNLQIAFSTGYLAGSAAANA